QTSAAKAGTARAALWTKAQLGLANLYSSEAAASADSFSGEATSALQKCWETFASLDRHRGLQLGEISDLKRGTFSVLDRTIASLSEQGKHQKALDALDDCPSELLQDFPDIHAQLASARVRALKGWSGQCITEGKHEEIGKRLKEEGLPADNRTEVMQHVIDLYQQAVADALTRYDIETAIESVNGGEKCIEHSGDDSRKYLDALGEGMAGAWQGRVAKLLDERELQKAKELMSKLPRDCFVYGHAEPAFADLSFALGEKLFHNGNVEESMATFENAIAFGAGVPAACECVGEICQASLKQLVLGSGPPAAPKDVVQAAKVVSSARKFLTSRAAAPGRGGEAAKFATEALDKNTVEVIRALAKRGDYRAVNSLMNSFPDDVFSAGDMDEEQRISLQTHCLLDRLAAAPPEAEMSRPVGDLAARIGEQGELLPAALRIVRAYILAELQGESPTTASRAHQDVATELVFQAGDSQPKTATEYRRATVTLWVDRVDWLLTQQDYKQASEVLAAVPGDLSQDPLYQGIFRGKQTDAACRHTEALLARGELDNADTQLLAACKSGGYPIALIQRLVVAHTKKLAEKLDDVASLAAVSEARDTCALLDQLPEAAQRAEEYAQSAVRIWCERVLRLAKDGKLDRAELLLQDLPPVLHAAAPSTDGEKDRCQAEVNCLRAVSLVEQGRFREAGAAFEKAVELDWPKADLADRGTKAILAATQKALDEGQAELARDATQFGDGLVSALSQDGMGAGFAPAFREKALGLWIAKLKKAVATEEYQEGRRFLEYVPNEWGEPSSEAKKVLQDIAVAIVLDSGKKHIAERDFREATLDLNDALSNGASADQVADVAFTALRRLSTDGDSGHLQGDRSDSELDVAHLFSGLAPSVAERTQEKLSWREKIQTHLLEGRPAEALQQVNAMLKVTPEDGGLLAFKAHAEKVSDMAFIPAIVSRGKEAQGFYIDKEETSNREYDDFCKRVRYVDYKRLLHPADAPGRKLFSPSEERSPGRTPKATDGPDYPAVRVSWFDAYTYATFRGKRLPSGSEWKRAIGRHRYPWGDDLLNDAANTKELGKKRLSKTDEFLKDQSEYGVRHLAGNAAEWLGDAGRTDLDRQVAVGSYVTKLYKRVPSFAAAPRTTAVPGIGFRCASDALPAVDAQQ
ncbi:MAG: SUMF1/EgtB/PvdO family nonheme iron enzyme, partial [Verrucomicrobia bacterium]|nr:SUMF1/EgtB/PvdO family nonheme iron enzyme [Verrucomicrobiota bacterium]